MKDLLYIFVLIPSLGFLINLIVPKKEETILTRVATITMGLQFIATFIFCIFWIINDFPSLYTKELSLFKSESFELFIDFSFDKITAVYLLVGAFLAFLITAYSRNYLHRESGFKRFFNTIMFFYLGFNIIVLSGNLATLYIGWEIAGVSSFLLIGYYRNRYIPVKNAVKIFSVYRLADVALLIAMWAGHHIWHKNIIINQFDNYNSVSEHISEHTSLAILFSICILVAAAVKSAQLPFCSWLPRAMEGPTPSSAIFYSSLSAHLGVLLLLRTYHFWDHLPSIKIAIIVLGATTFIIAITTARIQSSIKGQIAYSAIAQIGLMFIEVALGWHVIALVHFAGNAFLRSYQLLVSPSIITYLIREQFYSFVPKTTPIKKGLINKLRNSIYMLSLKEWNLDEITHQALWNSFKSIGNKFHYISIKTLTFIATVMLFFFFGGWFFKDNFGDICLQILPILLLSWGLLLSIRAFTERKSVQRSILLIVLNNFFIALALVYCENIPILHIGLYLGGVTGSALIGILAIRNLRKTEKKINLAGYQGHCYEYPRTEILFMIGCLGVFGFPVSTSFLGMELMFGYIHPNQIAFLALVSLSLLVNGLAMIRMYARIFLGPHIKSYHESAQRSA
jgi:NADH-quinone oxidoreductase subunit L